MRWRAVTSLVLGLSVLLPATAASAHPLDVYLQATYLTFDAGSVDVEVDLSPGVLVAPTALRALDADRDGTLTEEESRAYAEKVVAALTLRIDGAVARLALASLDVSPYLTLKAGYGTLRLHARTATAPSADGQHEAFFRNGFAPKGSAWQVNGFVAKGAPVALSEQRRAADQQQTTITYRIDPTARGTGVVRSDPRASTGRLASYLQRGSLSAGVVLVALLAAALLGALHALTPGHAKTLMAAYLVGSGGTARNALTLGAVVTFTHTASVVVIGMLALLASDFLVPELLVPSLELVAGGLVLVLGLRLVRQRWSHHQHEHEHGSHTHTHELPDQPLTPRGLVAMGVSGGLVPCPEALGVMIVAVGVNRTVLGLGLIVAFSLGLAAVLMGLGLVLVRSRTFLARSVRLSAHWTMTLPRISAIVVTTLGLVLVLKGATEIG